MVPFQFVERDFPTPGDEGGVDPIFAESHI
jgi:hypothetical protein